jgi:hypothetical protein
VLRLKLGVKDRVKVRENGILNGNVCGCVCYLFLLLDIKDYKNTSKSASSDFHFGIHSKVYPCIVERCDHIQM